MDDLKAKANTVKKHPSPKEKASQAAKAAKGPPNEKAAGAKAKQVDKVKKAKTGKPESSSFLALLRAEIQKAMPKTLGDTEKFMKGGQSEAMKGGLKGNVSQQKETSTADVKSANQQAPSESGVAATPGGAVAADAPPPSAPVDAAAGMPAPKSETDVSLQDSKQDTDAQMKEAEVTPEQCKKANDPRFSAVLASKDQVAKQADTAPGKYRAAENATLVSKAAQAKGEAAKGAATLRNTRTGANSAVLTKQQQQKKKDEEARQKISTQIEAIFNATKAKVDAKLNKLDDEVNSIFDAGTDAALTAMKNFVEEKIRDYKLNRYLLQIGGSLLWIRDQFKGLPDEVNVFYEQGRQMFTRQMDVLVVRVANLVETRLAEAKQIVNDGQAEIKKFVASQPKELQAFAQEAERNVASRFDELRNSIDEKKNQLAQALAQKYKEAFDKANEELKKIQDANKGLVQAFVEKLAEIIKMLREFKDKLMGLLRKGADTIKLILADPIGFLGNLVAALKLGFNNFKANIWTHLKAGFMQWLFGSLASAGVEIPSDLSLPSILKLVLGILGITYDRMRAKAVKLLGPTVVTIIEKVVEYVKALISGGPKALWEKVKEDLSDLKAMVIDAIQNWLIETVVKQAIAKVVTMFNPAGAIVQAIIMIYNVVMFVIEKAAQIMALLEAVVNSVSAIASGAISGAAAWIEKALARTIPVLIGLLASLIGLGGISDKIKEIIKKVQATVDRAIDKALAKIVALVKKLFGGGKKGGKPDARTDAQKMRDLQQAVREGTAIAKAESDNAKSVRSKLSALRQKYDLTKLELVSDGGVKHHVVGEVNPTYPGDVITVTNFDDLLAKVPSGAKADVKRAVQAATDKQKAVQKIYDTATAGGALRPTKTVSLADEVTISGWGSLDEALLKYTKGQQVSLTADIHIVHSYIVANTVGLKKYGYQTKPFIFDPRKAKGAYFESHAEKQSFINALGALKKDIDAGTKKAIASVGVSRPLCPDDCFPFFRAVAQLERITIVIADPLGAFVFMPDGQVLRKLVTKKK